MRMWMVDTSKMCNKHLLGEHVELHMLIGTLKRNKKINGFIKNNCVEVSSIYKRHEDIVNEMNKRNMKHKSDLEQICLNNYSEYFTIKVNSKQSLIDLLERCENCRKINKINSEE